MSENPYDAPAARSDASMLLDLQQVSRRGVSFVVVAISPSQTFACSDLQQRLQ